MQYTFILQVSPIPRLSCYYRKQSRKTSLQGDVQNIIITKIKFRFLGNRQVEHIEGTQLTLSIQLHGNTNKFPCLEIQTRFLM